MVTQGQAAPDFTLPNQDGEMVTISSFKGKKNVVLYFYPKDMTPGCTQESCDFRDNIARIQSADTEVFGISKDSEKSHQKFREKEGLPFDLLSDTEGKVLDLYGVWKEKSMYGKTFLGIERSTYLIDRDGNIAHIWKKVSVKGHVDAVLEEVKKLA